MPTAIFPPSCFFSIGLSMTFSSSFIQKSHARCYFFALMLLLQRIFHDFFESFHSKKSCPLLFFRSHTSSTADFPHLGSYNLNNARHLQHKQRAEYRRQDYHDHREHKRAHGHECCALFGGNHIVEHDVGSHFNIIVPESADKSADNG